MRPSINHQPRNVFLLLIVQKKEGRSLPLIRKGRKVGPNHLKLRPGIIDTGTLAFQNHSVSMTQ